MRSDIGFSELLQGPCGEQAIGEQAGGAEGQQLGGLCENTGER